MDIPHVWYGVFAVWDGGLGIWGGIALATVVGLWRLRRHGVNTAQFMDAVAPALLVAQGIGRIGNYFNKELFGSPTSLPWGLDIPYQYRLSGGIPGKYLNFSTFQPTFLYELIFDFAWAAVLVWLGSPPQDQAAGPVRAVRVRLFAVPDLRGVAAHRLLGVLPRPAPEHLHRLGPGRDRPVLVLAHPAPPRPEDARARPRLDPEAADPPRPAEASDRPPRPPTPPTTDPTAPAPRRPVPGTPRVPRVPRLRSAHG